MNGKAQDRFGALDRGDVAGIAACLPEDVLWEGCDCI